MSAKTLVPSSEKGVAYFIMLNTYNDAGAGADNWSLQVRFNVNQGFVKSDGPTGGQTNLILDKWTTLRAYIDLTADKVMITYGNTVLTSTESWTNGLSGGGLPRIDVLDALARNHVSLDERRIEDGLAAALSSFFDDSTKSFASLLSA